MAYNDKTLKTDLEGKPIPQAFSDSVGDFEAIKSTNGALHQVLYGANGLPISIVNNKLAVRATEIEALLQGFATEGKLEQVRALLQNVSDKDFAKDETLEQARALLDAISTKDFATQTTLAAVLAKLADLESELATIKANQLSGNQKVQLSGTITEVVLADGMDITAGSTVYIPTSEIENVELINLAKKARLYYNGTGIANTSITHDGRLGAGATHTARTVLVEGLPGGGDTRIINDIVIEPLLLTKGSLTYTRFAFTNTGESDAKGLRAVLALKI